VNDDEITATDEKIIAERNITITAEKIFMFGKVARLKK
jgi:hypothetical protein